MKKFDNIEAGLIEIENIDRKIVGHLDREDYSKIIEELKNRLIVISQITQLKQKNTVLSEAISKKFEQIFSDTSLIQLKILEKKSKISERLKKYKKNQVIYRNRSY
ncbi:MAG: hypothetical protein RLZZ361_127 [Cyanobacteriota bacterium]|jgi:hypothetical protein